MHCPMLSSMGFLQPIFPFWPGASGWQHELKVHHPLLPVLLHPQACWGHSAPSSTSLTKMFNRTKVIVQAELRAAQENSEIHCYEDGQQCAGGMGTLPRVGSSPEVEWVGKEGFGDVQRGRNWATSGEKIIEDPLNLEKISKIQTDHQPIPTMPTLWLESLWLENTSKIPRSKPNPPPRSPNHIPSCHISVILDHEPHSWDGPGAPFALHCIFREP